MPRRERNHRALHLLAIGMTAGFALFAAGVWVASLIGDRHFPVIAYLVVGVIGSGIGLVLLPYIALARSDGEDAGIVRRRSRRGRADAPVEGAEAADEGRAPAGAARHP